MIPVKADLHNHFRTSSVWKEGDFNKAIKVAHNRLNSFGMVGLVNFSDKRYESFVGLKGYERTKIGEKGNAFYIPEKMIFVIKGQEVPTIQGHLLVFGLGMNEHIKEGRNLEDTLKEAKDYDGIIVADHPFGRDGLGPYLEKNRGLLEKFDAIETFNGEAIYIPILLPQYANTKAQAFYNSIRDDFDIGQLSSSDGHSFYEIGRNWTQLNLQFDQDPRDKSGGFINDLKGAIRATGEYETEEGFDEREMNQFSLVGAYDHIIDLGAIIGLSKVPRPIRKLIGVNHYIDVERPNQ